MGKANPISSVEVVRKVGAGHAENKKKRFPLVQEHFSAKLYRHPQECRPQDKFASILE
jgi:hypothetical protein